MSRTFKYVVVVHGMGDARPGETCLPVVSRFAEARAGASLRDGGIGSVATLARASTMLREHGWVEFDGIPVTPGEPPARPFIGEPVDPNAAGANLRFVDVHWNDLLDQDVKAVADSPQGWADGLLQRLKRGRPNAPTWIIALLASLSITVGIVERLLAWRASSVRDLAFNAYLGDVQVYGEHVATRSHALRRFHERLSDIVGAHAKSSPGAGGKGTADDIEFHVIAHSLGSVMAFDALTLAHATALRTGDAAAVRALLPGYDDPDEPRGPRATVRCTGEWIDRVKSFTTIGSPIDKFLILWWPTYRRLCADAAGGTVAWLEARRGKILHFNYAEEQDPVGHQLDLVRSTEGYTAIFETAEDLSYMRSALPGLAHIAYWHDRDLFRWILARAVDGKEEADATAPTWFSTGVHESILRLTYYAPALLAGFSCYFIGSWARSKAEIASSILAGGALILVGWLWKQIIDLMIWWRQILARKRSTCGTHADAQLRAKRRETFMNVRLPGAAFVWLALSATSAFAWGAVCAADAASSKGFFVTAPAIALGITLAFGPFVWRFFLKTQLVHWDKRKIWSDHLARAAIHGLAPPITLAFLGWGLLAHTALVPPEYAEVLDRVIFDLMALGALCAAWLFYAWRRLRAVRDELATANVSMTYRDYLSDAKQVPDAAAGQAAAPGA